MTIIGLCGFAGAGKDAVGEILVREHGFRRIAFADKLKEVAIRTDPTIAALVQHEGWEGAKSLSWVRTLLQDLGVAVRDVLGENTWVTAALRDVKGYEDVVVTDVRFPNEVNAIQKSLMGSVWRIDRLGVGPANDHVSEHAWLHTEFDRVLTNNSSLERLGDAVERALHPPKDAGIPSRYVRASDFRG